MSKMNTGIGVSMDSEYTMNDDTPVGVASGIQEGVTPSVVDITVEMGKRNSLDDTTILESFPPLSTSVTTTVGNAPGKSSYANIIGKPSGKKVNVCTLFTPNGNGIYVVAYPVVTNNVRNTWGKYRLVRSMFSLSTGSFSFQFSSMNGLDAMLENGPWFIRNNPLILKKWHPDENLLKEDVSTVLVWVKLHGVPVTIFSEDDLSAIATKLGAGEKKTMNKHSQNSQGTSVSNSNLFDVLNSVDNNVKFGTNWGTTNLVNNGAPSSGSSFMNVDNSSYGTTPIIEKIRKFEDLLTSGQAILVDKAGNALKKVEFLGEYDSEDEVASVDNDMTHSMAYERVCFDTQSLLKQWRDSYGNCDYDDDPYDDDMYECQDLSHELQAICDNLDICVRGRKKK
nr:hypothetical protein [Tanacetum cinerariifolium]